MGEKVAVEASGFEIYSAPDEQAGTGGPLHFHRGVVLPAVLLTCAENPASAIGIAVAVEESAGSGILEHIFLSVRQ